MGEVSRKDEFGENIYQTIIKYQYTHNLEIGSLDGAGSTQCFIEAMEYVRKNTGKEILLQCLEIDAYRHSLLLDNIKGRDFVKTYMMSSIDKKSCLVNSFEEMWNSPFNGLNGGPYSKELVKTWYEQNIPLLNDFGFLNSDLRLPEYDMVLIDGSEFLGYSEFVLLKDSTKCFALDDVFHAYKCNQAYNELKKDPSWEILSENPNVRNGYAILRKI